MTLDTLPTPALVLDRRRLVRNARRLGDRVPSGVRLRPHMKTCKSIDVARIALEGRDPTATVSTLKEAEYFHSHGLSDLTYAVGVSPDKLDRAAALMRDGCGLNLVTDDAGVARAIAAKGRELDVEFSVYVECDVDGHRAGVSVGGEALLEIGRTLHASAGARLAGVLTHAGESYLSTDEAAISHAAEEERAGAAEAARRLREAGLTCPEASVGSSPTAMRARSFEGLTEVRAGVYLFWDLFQSNLGHCGLDDIAISVLGTVIGHQQSRGWLIVDAGGHALSKDRGTATQRVDYAFGQVCRPDGTPVTGWLVTKANQEHGVIESLYRPLDFDRHPIGSRLRILPNHACATAACHDRYAVVDGGADVVDQWHRVNGW